VVDFVVGFRDRRGRLHNKKNTLVTLGCSCLSDFWSKTYVVLRSKGVNRQNRRAPTVAVPLVMRPGDSAFSRARHDLADLLWSINYYDFFYGRVD